MISVKIKRQQKMFGGNYNAIYVNDIYLGAIDRRKKEIKFVYEIGYKDEYYKAKEIFFQYRETILKELNMKYIYFYGWSVC